MIDHLTLSVANYEQSRDLYSKVLAPLGYTLLREFMEWKVGGWGDKKPYLWVKEAQPVTTPQHIAFIAKDRAAVDAFHKAALALGFKDDGAPGIREVYHPHYYGAFVIDPLNGHPMEAVCHQPPGGAKAAATRAKKPKKAAKSKARAKKPAAKKRR